jgi:hypothetical protein
MKAILQRYILPSLTGRGRGVGLLLPFLLAACSTTSHLPEGEQLYTGITEIAYGHKAGSKKGTKADSHIKGELRYESTNIKIATVSKTGKIVGKGKGTCYVYAYAQNGVCKKVKVTVK